MWGTARFSAIVPIHDENDDQGQIPSVAIKVSSAPGQLHLAPLVSFDEYGDIPSPIVQQSNNSPEHPSIHSCWPSRCSRKDFCQHFVQFLFSQFGLIILVSIYLIFGGFLFYGIESNYESRRNQQIKFKHLHGIDNIRHIVMDEFNWMLNVSFELRYALWRGMLSRLDSHDRAGWRVEVFPERFDRLIEAELSRMHAEEEKLVDKHDIRTDAAYHQKWTYSSAVLYSATVITTVGYGNITPKSILGKLITCLYAMIGIPIMIMYLTNTGDLLAFCFIKYYSMMKNLIHQINRRRQKKPSVETENVPDYYHVPIVAAVSVVGLYILSSALLFSHWEGWSYVDSAYFSFITFTTIGLGDLVPAKGTLTDNKNGKSVLCALYLLFGLVLTTMCFRLIQDDLFAIKERIFSRFGFRTYYRRYHHRHHFYHIRQYRVHLPKNKG